MDYVFVCLVVSSRYNNQAFMRCATPYSKAYAKFPTLTARAENGKWCSLSATRHPTKAMY